MTILLIMPIIIYYLTQMLLFYCHLLSPLYSSYPLVPYLT